MRNVKLQQCSFLVSKMIREIITKTLTNLKGCPGMTTEFGAGEMMLPADRSASA